jgi:hypothetical protein
VPWRSSLQHLAPGESAVVLSRGRRLELVLRTSDGRALPDTLAPIVFDGELLPWVWSCRFGSPGTDPGYALDRYGSRSFLVSAPASDAHLFVLIDEPGFLRGFQAGPVTDTMIVTGRLEIPLPAPAVVRCLIEPPAASPEGGDLLVEVKRRVVLPAGSIRTFVLERRPFDPGTSEIRFDDLAPGTYTFTLVGGTPSETEPDSESQRKIELSSAATYEVVLSSP